MTTIVINAISVKEGGSLVVLDRLLAEMTTLRPGWRWVVATSTDAAARLPALQNCSIRTFPELGQSGLKTRLWYETGLPRLLGEEQADLLFSHTNYLPMRRLSCPALLLVQHAGHFSPVFGQLTEARLGLAGRVAWRLKGRWVRTSVRVADAVTVQTEALAGQIARVTDVAREHIRVIPHGPGLTMLQSKPITPFAQRMKFRVGYITRVGVQKNFPVLIEAMARLKQKGMLVSLVLTLSEKELENRRVLDSAQRYGLADIIENHGESTVEAIELLYQSLHAFVFPSLCESFGFPLVEAMAHGLPLLVADVDSNTEVAGAAGIPFPPHDPIALAGEIERLAADSEWFRQRALASLVRGAEYKWAKAAAETVSLMDGLMSYRCDK